jgi:hypothetical protein
LEDRALFEAFLNLDGFLGWAEDAAILSADESTEESRQRPVVER